MKTLLVLIALTFTGCATFQTQQPDSSWQQTMATLRADEVARHKPICPYIRDAQGNIVGRDTNPAHCTSIAENDADNSVALTKAVGDLNYDLKH